MNEHKAYDRGMRDTRLDVHDGIFRRLEIAQIISYVFAACGFTWLALSTQRLGDGAKASAATAIALAQALKEEKDTARDTLATETNSTAHKWSKANIVIAAAAALATFVLALYALRYAPG